ncbi:MAG: hypothetical protein GX357_10555 [Firmicutes bacterium]|nr:hypothetical protein [Bacillota bacterium]
MGQALAMERIIFLLMTIVIIVGIVSPKTIWMLRTGWRIKGAEPTKAALVVTRIVMIIAAIILITMIKSF